MLEGVEEAYNASRGTTAVEQADQEIKKEGRVRVGQARNAQRCFWTSSSVGPSGSPLPARLHCLKTLTSSGVNAPTTECRTPRLWKSTMSLGSQSGRKSSIGGQEGSVWK